MELRHRVEFGLLIVVTAVIVLRPLVAETYDAAPAPFSQAVGTLDDPMPVRTAVFDVIILACACGWLALRAFQPAQRYQWTGLEWGLLLLVPAVMLSCAWAGNKRLAINASLDWLCYPLLAILLVQLLRKSWWRKLVAAAVIASACVQAYHCLEQHYVGQSETLAYYQSIKDTFWQAQGVELSSPTVELFERRMNADEAQGFLPHSNVAGSYLILAAFVVIGLGFYLRRRTLTLTHGSTFFILLQLLILAVILYAAFLTRSLGAAVAGGLGLMFWVGRWCLSRPIARHPRKFLVFGWATTLISAAAFVGHGLTHDGFANMSLTFRWQYWKASWPMIRNHWLTGVGRENFGRHYLHYKSIAASEEISNPHNLFVQAAADWGLMGLAAILAMLVGVTIVLTNRRAQPAAAHPPLSRRGSMAYMVAAGLSWFLVVTVLRTPLLGNHDPSFLYYTTVVTALCFATGLTAFAIPIARVSQPDIDHKVQAARGPFVAALTAGLFAFMVHETISFALFVPATATTFCAVLAIRLAESNKVAQRNSIVAAKPTRWLTPLLAVAATTAITIFLVTPVWRSNNLLRQARAIGTNPSYRKADNLRAADLCQAAANADPLDPAPYAELAHWHLTASTGQPDRAHALAAASAALEQAIRRDPYYIRYRRMQWRLELLWADVGGDQGHLLRAIDAARAALKLYPQDPDELVALADTLAVAARKTGRVELALEAIQRYRQALDLDNQRAWFERIRRFSPKVRQAIVQRIESLQHFLFLYSGRLQPSPLTKGGLRGVGPLRNNGEHSKKKRHDAVMIQ